jgi:hypothetical protein
MALRTGHGNGAGVPRVEVLPPDEAPSPVAAPVPVDDGPPDVRHGGRFADSETARRNGRKGGIRKASRVRLVDSLGLSAVVAETSFGPYRAAAEEFTKHHLGALAKQAGGEVGPAPSTMVASAALQLAASRWAFDQGAEKSDAALMKLGSQLANDSRQNLLAAYEMAVREAQARPRPRFDPLAKWRRPTDGQLTPPKPTEGK